MILCMRVCLFPVLSCVCFFSTLPSISPIPPCFAIGLHGDGHGWHEQRWFLRFHRTSCALVVACCGWVRLYPCQWFGPSSLQVDVKHHQDAHHAVAHVASRARLPRTSCGRGALLRLAQDVEECKRLDVCVGVAMERGGPPRVGVGQDHGRSRTTRL